MLHANTQAQAVFCDIDAFVSVWCTLQMLMSEHRLHKFHESIFHVSMFHVSIFHVRIIDANTCGCVSQNMFLFRILRFDRSARCSCICLLYARAWVVAKYTYVH